LRSAVRLTLPCSSFQNRLLDLGERLAGRTAGIAEELEAAVEAAPAE